MGIHGYCLAFPIRTDERGTFATISDPAQIAEQFLIDLIETRLMEHVQVPGYGLPDRVFSVMGATFVARLAAELEEQAGDYLKTLRIIKVLAGEGGSPEDFIPGFTLDQNRAAISVSYQVNGEASPRNMVYPNFRFVGLA